MVFRPWVYPQRANLTRPLEKLAYRVLAVAMREHWIGGYSTVSAWGDFDPVKHVRVGDVDELDEDEGVEVVPADWNPAAAP